jgi:hypothetical protein
VGFDDSANAARVKHPRANNTFAHNPICEQYVRRVPPYQKDMFADPCFQVNFERPAALGARPNDRCRKRHCELGRAKGLRTAVGGAPSRLSWRQGTVLPVPQLSQPK